MVLTLTLVLALTLTLAHVPEQKSSQTAIFLIILRIDDWILGDLGTANPFQVVVYLEMGLKSRVMRVNDLKINS